MHQNAPLPDKKIKKISGEGARPPPQPPTPNPVFKVMLHFDAEYLING